MSDEVEYRVPRNHDQADELADEFDVTWDGEPNLAEKKEILEATAVQRGLIEKKQDGPDAPYGFDVVGADGRRILRGVTEAEARAEAHRIESLTGEDIDWVKADAPAPSAPGLSGPTEPPLLANVE